MIKSECDDSVQLSVYEKPRLTISVGVDDLHVYLVCIKDMMRCGSFNGNV